MIDKSRGYAVKQESGLWFQIMVPDNEDGIALARQWVALVVEHLFDPDMGIGWAKLSVERNA